MPSSVDILNMQCAQLKRSLDPSAPLVLGTVHEANHGLYGFERGRETWMEYLPLIGSTLFPIRPYSVLDLGCNCGAKSHFLCAWGCQSYTGIDQLPQAIQLAQRRLGCGLKRFKCGDLFTCEWPQADVLALFYVLQHLVYEKKLALLRKMAQARPKVVLLVDCAVLDVDLDECARVHERSWMQSLTVPLPLGHLTRTFDSYDLTRRGELFLFTRRA